MLLGTLCPSNIRNIQFCRSNISFAKTPEDCAFTTLTTLGDRFRTAFTTLTTLGGRFRRFRNSGTGTGKIPAPDLPESGAVIRYSGRCTGRFRFTGTDSGTHLPVPVSGINNQGKGMGTNFGLACKKLYNRLFPVIRRRLGAA